MTIDGDMIGCEHPAMKQSFWSGRVSCKLCGEKMPTPAMRARWKDIDEFWKEVDKSMKETEAYFLEIHRDLREEWKRERS